MPQEPGPARAPRPDSCCGASCAGHADDVVPHARARDWPTSERTCTKPFVVRIKRALLQTQMTVGETPLGVSLARSRARSEPLSLPSWRESTTTGTRGQLLAALWLAVFLLVFLTLGTAVCLYNKAVDAGAAHSRPGKTSGARPAQAGTIGIAAASAGGETTIIPPGDGHPTPLPAAPPASADATPRSPHALSRTECVLPPNPQHEIRMPHTCTPCLDFMPVCLATIAS